MERKMTNLIFPLTVRDQRSTGTSFGSPGHEPTPLEIQRWEDDGGAILPEQSRRRRIECEETCTHLHRSAA
jgi:hypothetical protein